MCTVAPVEMKHMKLQHFIKGPELRLKHTTTSERSGKASEKSGSEVRVINLLRC